MASTDKALRELSRQELPQSHLLAMRDFFGEKHRVYVISQFVATGVAFVFGFLWWFRDWHPSPGISVAIIAVVAATMSIHADMHKGHKAWWMLIIGAFLVLEIAAIRHGEEEQANKQQVALAEERKHFGEIGKGIERAIAQSDQDFSETMNQFGAVLRKSERVAELTQESIADITGGDSFAIVTPQVWSGMVPIPLSIRNYGKRSLTGITVSIRNSRLFSIENPRSFYDLPVIQVGTLHPGELRTLKETITPRGDFKDEDGTPLDIFDIDIAAQNFTAEEHLLFKKGSRIPWVFKYQVTRQYIKSQTGTETKFGYKVLANQKDWLGER